ncbi:c-type cytochrome [Pedobacter changchengzhani]|uniref:Photosynthetic reaction center cytochrome c subunit n=1 Tax=Pedobacter changchengzhani TaxID=2529274 RepID=A0A4R5MHR6_9SPHI|nr:c-type cytochrome [Pedobacter changchengzhani]TDG35100.1 c-type cytochrome [Pedobacter changchengzhani]
MKYRKFSVIALLLSTVIAMSAFMPKNIDDHKPKNLKVLPKDISHADLDTIMVNFKLALGVKCNHCHASMADDPKKLDFASDAKPEKETARYMMRMTAKLNKKYFSKEMHDGKSVNSVNCITCHNGKTAPAK